MLISIALTVSGSTPRRRSEKAHIRIRSQPCAGSTPSRPGACCAKGRLKPRATTASPSVAIRTYSGNSATIRGYSSQASESCWANSGQESFMSQSRAASSGRSAMVLIMIPVIVAG